MTSSALLLVLLSAGLHAFWNYLAKKAGDQVAFMFLIMAASPIIWLVPLIWMLWHGQDFGAWYWPLLGGFFQAAYCFLMGRGYACGDLSQVYPLARGLAPALIAVIAWQFMPNEGLSVIGVLGIAAIVIGILVLNLGNCTEAGQRLTLRSMFQPATRLALLAAICIAGYHMTDKAGAMSAHSAFAYLCLMHVYLVAFLAVFTRILRKPAEIRREWHTNWRSIMTVTFACFTAYFLVVYAMTLAQVAYIASLRNVSIMFSVLLGVTALKEQGWMWRVGGALLMLAGIGAIALAG